MKIRNLIVLAVFVKTAERAPFSIDCLFAKETYSWGSTESEREREKRRLESRDEYSAVYKDSKIPFSIDRYT